MHAVVHGGVKCETPTEGLPVWVDAVTTQLAVTIGSDDSTTPELCIGPALVATNKCLIACSS